MKPVLDKKTDAAASERRLEILHQYQRAIAADQQRLRENMKALRGSPEEKQLLQRYTRQLDAQETRLAELDTQVAQATSELERLRSELSVLITRVSFDLSAG
jgi:chromosome segregation ATPase